MSSEGVQQLREGDAVPHFQAVTTGGAPFNYASIWQRKNLVLVAVPAAADVRVYAAALAAHACEFEQRRAECLVTRDAIAGLPAPAVLVADKWGEIIHIERASAVADLPSAAELVEWVDFVERRCPECEGEAR